MSEAVKLLADLLQAFVSRNDRSMALVDRVERVLIDRFKDGELYEGAAEHMK